MEQFQREAVNASYRAMTFGVTVCYIPVILTRFTSH